MDDGHGIINYARPPNLPYLGLWARSGMHKYGFGDIESLSQACRRLVAGLCIGM